MFVAIIPHS